MNKQIRVSHLDSINQMYPLLYVATPLYTPAQSSAMLGSHQFIYSEPYSALASLPSILQLYIPKSVTGRHELWLSFWSQQNPNPACQVTCHLCTVCLIKGHCVKVGVGRKKAEFALIAHQNKKLCLLREINVKALSLKSEHRAKSLGSFISIRKRNDC